MLTSAFYFIAFVTIFFAIMLLFSLQCHCNYLLRLYSLYLQLEHQMRS